MKLFLINQKAVIAAPDNFEARLWFYTDVDSPYLDEPIENCIEIPADFVIEFEDPPPEGPFRAHAIELLEELGGKPGLICKRALV